MNLLVILNNCLLHTIPGTGPYTDFNYNNYGWDEVTKPFLIILAISFAIVVLVYYLSYRLNGGKGILYKSLQDYGPDHFITLGMLNNIASDIVESHGYDSIDLRMSHEVGNRYVGYFYDRFGHMHDIVITTDGWNMSYSIDGSYFRPYK